jgi:dihydrofolate reductase
MPKLRLNTTMSLDGYVAGPEQSLENPLGVRGEDLHLWMFPTRSFREAHGAEAGGETGLDDERVAAVFENVGAYIMGRNMFGPERGPWSDDPWRGWWGDNPPYHTPVFVLTHHAREPLEMEEGTTFHFVTDGPQAALERAFAAADGKDVAMHGGARTLQQYLRLRLVDEMEIHVAPVLLGGGSRLFEGVEDAPLDFTCVSVESSPAVAHFRYVRRNS